MLVSDKEYPVNDASKRALQWTDAIIKKTGPRLAGSSACQKAAQLIEKDMEKICDNVQIEPFSIHPQAFLDWIRILILFYLTGVILLWLNLPWISALLIGFGLLIMILEFFLYKSFVDPIFPKKTGMNVVGTIEPEGEVKQQIIISGHHDSAYVFNFLYKNPKLYSIRVFGGIGSITLLFIDSLIFSIWNLFSSIQNSPVSLWYLGFNILLSSLFLLVGQLWFFRGSQGTPGAGDNLISIGIALEVGKYFSEKKEANQGLHHTRIILGSWDGEEAGLRGARAYVKKHLAELKSLPTYNFNIDCPYFLRDLFFLTTDVNGSVTLSESMAKTCVQIAHDNGYPAEAKNIEFLTGGTDAGEFGRENIAATSLMAMPWGNQERAAAYHTPMDTIDVIEPEVVQACIDISQSFVHTKENEL